MAKPELSGRFVLADPDLVPHTGRAASVIIALCMVGVLGFLDYTTGYLASFSVFYLAPILFVTGSVGRIGGAVFAFISTAVWATAEHLTHAQLTMFLLAWNALTHLLFFLIIAVSYGRLIDRLRLSASLAGTDELTKLFNARVFYRRLREELERCRRTDAHFSLAYIDVDDFKTVNDTRGHAEGDRLLRDIARDIRDAVRSTDTPARLGGDEFALLLPETDQDGARDMLSRLRDRIAARITAEGWPVGLSIGVVTGRGDAGEADEVVRLADDLMYSVKFGGKNDIAFEHIGPDARTDLDRKKGDHSSPTASDTASPSPVDAGDAPTP